MASICFYFQVHQPYRLRHYSVFSHDPFYFDNDANQAICEKVANKCYRPTTAKLIDLVKRHEGRFRVSFSLSGVVLEQWQMWCPDLIEMMQELVATGACEIIGETSHHSLAFLYSKEEFYEQVHLHEAQLMKLFGVQPKVFRNTELTYSNALAETVAELGTYDAMLCEGVERYLGYRSPNYIYVPPKWGNDPAAAPLKVLLKNYQLSDDIAFRFSNKEWSEWPLKAERFAEWVNQINGDGYLCNLFMDYETFGEHQWEDSGIFDFLDSLPEKVFDFNPGKNDFATTSEALKRAEPIGTYDVPEVTSWADTERDLSAWLGNEMQQNAATELFKLEDLVKAMHKAGDTHILEDWRKLTTSDHLYYMCTKYWSDGDVHKYFSPYDSPYDAYINFMNVLDNVRTRVDANESLPSQPLS